MALKSFLFKSCGKCSMKCFFFYVDNTTESTCRWWLRTKLNCCFSKQKVKNRTILRSIRCKTKQERGKWNREIKCSEGKTLGSKSSEGKRHTSRPLNHHPCFGFVFTKYTLTVWIMYIIAEECSKLWLLSQAPINLGMKLVHCRAFFSFTHPLSISISQGALNQILHLKINILHGKCLSYVLIKVDSEQNHLLRSLFLFICFGGGSSDQK